MPFPNAIVQRVRQEAEAVLLSGKSRIEEYEARPNDYTGKQDDSSLYHWLRSWYAGLSNVNEQEWIDERVKLLTDLTYLLDRWFHLTYAENLMDKYVHGAFIQHLEHTQPFYEDRPKKQQQNLYLMARSTFKTTIMSAMAIQTALRDPRARVAIASFRQEEAEDRLQPLKRILESDQAMHFFPDRVWPRQHKWRPDTIMWDKASLQFRNSRRIGKDPDLCAVSSETPQTGAHFTDIHADDLVNEKSVKTRLMIRKCSQTWKYLQTCTEEWAILRGYGTFYDGDDLYNEMIREGGLNELWVVPAIASENWLKEYPQMRNKLWMGSRIRQDDLLFPNRLTGPALDERATKLGPFIFSCQYLLEPTART